jgi:hypothetical protein
MGLFISNEEVNELAQNAVQYRFITLGGAIAS